MSIPNVPVAPPSVAYSAIILPTPVSIVSKMAVVLTVFGVYMAGITMYTMRSEQYNFNGRMLWNFLMDRKEDVIPTVTHIKSTVQNHVPAPPHPPAIQVPPIASATQRGQRSPEESFVGTRFDPVIRPIQSMWARILAWTHVRGNTMYSRKIFA